MLDRLTHSAFARHEGERFTITLDGGEPYPLVLAAVERRGDAPLDAATSTRLPFTLLFVSERTDAYLPQRTYRLEHPEMGALEIFLVPLGPAPQGMRYEAIFS